MQYLLTEEELKNLSGKQYSAEDVALLLVAIFDDLHEHFVKRTPVTFASPPLEVYYPSLDFAAKSADFQTHLNPMDDPRDRLKFKALVVLRLIDGAKKQALDDLHTYTKNEKTTTPQTG